MAKIGVPREVKDNEYRVAITPSGVRELSQAGHEVYVESGAGEGSALPDDSYRAAGARLLADPGDVWAAGEILLKVKEPEPAEYGRMRPGQVLFTYLHLAANRPCTQAILDAKVTAIAYETVGLPGRGLPLLAPMSEVAGRMAPQVGAHFLERYAGGRGILMGGAAGVHPARVVVLGAGVGGGSAAAIALGMQAEVWLVDRDLDRLRAADRHWHGNVRTVASNTYEIERAVAGADLVVGAVLVPGAKAPMLVTDAMVGAMRPGSVLVDLSVDQGGSFESSRPTTHSDPVFQVGPALYYGVANMPGAVPFTSTFALTNATLPYVVEVASGGWADAVRADPALAAGVTAVAGTLTSEPVARAHDLPHTCLASVLAGAP
jgi:alanine dehydrogenase